MPSPTPTEPQIETVREITRLRSYDQTATLVDALNDSQWAATLTDLTEWAARRDKYTEIIKGPAGAKIDPAQRKLAITNRVRERLGLEPLTSSGNSAISSTWASMTVIGDV